MLLAQHDEQGMTEPETVVPVHIVHSSWGCLCRGMPSAARRAASSGSGNKSAKLSRELLSRYTWMRAASVTAQR